MKRASLVALIAGLFIILGAWLMPSAGAIGPVPRWYCSTTTAQGQACIPDPTTTHPTYPTTTHPTTTTSTTIATTTTKATTTTVCEDCIPDTQGTTSTTASTTTTVPRTTTTAPLCAGLCAGQFGTTSTTGATTTTTAATTVPVTTTVAPTTTVPIPPPSDEFVPPTTAMTELPHTGAASGPLAGAGLLLVSLGVLGVAVASRDEKRITFKRR